MKSHVINQNYRNCLLKILSNCFLTNMRNISLRFSNFKEWGRVNIGRKKPLYLKYYA